MLDHLLGRATVDWSTYMERWNPDEMAANWPEFAGETRQVLDRGRARLHLENELLYPLAVREGVLPLRSGNA